MKRLSLNIIGAGRVGSTLAQLWSQQNVFNVQALFSRNISHAQQAVEWAGIGTAYDQFNALPAADVWLISTPDHAIRDSCEQLLAKHVIVPGNTVFHCSGALGSEQLVSAQKHGAHIASAHPLKSFVERGLVQLDKFAGTPCAVEGDVKAIALLQKAFVEIGAKPFIIVSKHKSLYHAASVMVCNYQNALIEIGLQTYAHAGIPAEEALALIEPIVRNTIDNIFRMGPRDALTGPIVRGETEIVASEIADLHAWRPDIAAIYRQLGLVTLDLAVDRPDAPDLSNIQKVLEASDQSNSVSD